MTPSFLRMESWPMSCSERNDVRSASQPFLAMSIPKPSNDG